VITDRRRRGIVSDYASSNESKAVVDAYYQAGVQRRLTGFARYLHPDFSTTAPNYLPWGARIEVQRSSATRCCPISRRSSISAASVTAASLAEDDRVVALVNFGVTGSTAMIKIAEHWTVSDGNATSIWVAYFEPQALLDKLGIAHGLSQEKRS
jgi:hypothetical protein